MTIFVPQKWRHLWKIHPLVAPASLRTLIQKIIIWRVDIIRYIMIGDDDKVMVTVATDTYFEKKYFVSIPITRRLGLVSSGMLSLDGGSERSCEEGGGGGNNPII